MRQLLNCYEVTPCIEGAENPPSFLYETEADKEGAWAELQQDGWEIWSIKPVDQIARRKRRRWVWRR